jgi:hypothetical protein
MSKRISQREAMRNRRDLRRLREFVDGIRGSRSDYDAHVVTFTMTDSAWAASKLDGMMWGARWQLVALADFVEPNKLRVTVKRVPEAR